MYPPADTTSKDPASPTFLGGWQRTSKAACQAQERVHLSSEHLTKGPDESQATSVVLWGLLGNTGGEWLNNELSASACGSEGADSQLLSDDEDGPCCDWADEPETLVEPGLLKNAGLDRVIVSSAAVGGSHAIFVTTCSKAFGVGCNDRGQLGFGNYFFRYHPEQLPDLRDDLDLGNTGSSGFCYLAAACGGAHSLFLGRPCGKSRGKRVFASGACDVLGLEGCPCDQYLPQVVALPGEVTALAVRGNENCCAVQESVSSGEGCHLIYIWGNTHCFTCPHYLKLPCPIFKMPNAVRQLALGTYFGLASDVQGCVFAWGDSSHSDLGGAAFCEATAAARERLWQVSLHSREKHDLLEDLKNLPTPGRVSLPRGPDVPQCDKQDTRCSQNLLADSGSYPIPMAPPGLDANGPDRITDIACGERHALMLDEEGMLFSFGANFAGQCGIADDDDHRMRVSTVRFVPIKGFRAAKGSRRYIQGARIFAGRWHSAMISREDKLYIWGHPANQKLGHAGYNHDGTEAGESHSSKPRPPGVAVRSAFRDSVRKPTLVKTLLHRRIQTVGLGDECTIVVSGNGRAGDPAPQMEDEPHPQVAMQSPKRGVTFGLITEIDILVRGDDELPNLDELEAGTAKPTTFADASIRNDPGDAKDVHFPISL